jgi:prepilin-type N-terminal cleavage/methylation domain-containing protein
MKKGMTLIEILVTSTILMVGVSGLLVSFVECNKLIINNTNRYNASTIIDFWFEEIQRAENPTAVVNLLASTPSNYWWRDTNGDLVTYKQINRDRSQEFRVSFSVTAVVTPSGASDLSQITATVRWTDAEGPKSISMSMLTNEPV